MPRQCEAENCNKTVWGTCKVTRKGFCESHQWMRKDKTKAQLRKFTVEKKDRMVSKFRTLNNVAKEVMNPNDILYKQELERLFDKAAKVIADNPYCWECGTFIPDHETVYEKDKKVRKKTKRFYRAATAHIFPKKIFKSVATLDNSYVVAGAGCGCHGKTERLDQVVNMKIFPEIVDRYKQIRPFITEKNDLLNQYDVIIEEYEKGKRV